MLILLLPLMILLFISKMKNSWYLITSSLILITLITIINLTPLESHLTMSSMSSMDSMAALLISLTLWITCLMFQASLKILWKLARPNLFMCCTISLTIILTLCFSASNILLFYIWFEASLIPTMLLIMLWGYQPERIQASMYLMLYTVTASLPLLMMICLIYFSSDHLMMSYPVLKYPTTLNPYLSWLMTIMAFLVKLPLFLVHLWLPKAHVEAPIAGSMILAAILLKLGGYGLIRITLYFMPMTKLLSSPVMSTALIGGILTSLICLRQPDMKSIIAYSSIGHMGLMCAGIMSCSSLGYFGALTMMIAHAFSSSALFCLANITYDITKSRSLALNKGILTLIPLLSMWWFLLLCSNMAAPPSINLLSEILLITASTSYSKLLIIPIMLISFLSAAYSLLLYSSVNHGHPLTYMNMTQPLSPHYNTMLLMHLTPILMLMLNSNLVTTWM